MWGRFFACSLMLATGCAQGMDKGGMEEADPVDASRSHGFPDANPDIPDAAPPPPDAAPGGPDAAPLTAIDAGPADLFCDDSSECTAQGECCVILVQPPGFCAPGQEIGDVCFPE